MHFFISQLKLDVGHGQAEYAELVRKNVTDLLEGGAYLRGGKDANVS